MSARFLSLRCVLLIVGACLLPSEFAMADDPVPPQADLAAIDEFSAEILKRLDSIETLRTRRRELDVAAKRAPELLSIAEKAVNLARIAVVEYRDGTFRQDVATLEGEIKLAESEVQRAKDRVQWSDRVLKKGSISEGENLEDRMSLQKAEIALRNANKKLEVLQKYGLEREVTRLDSAVDKAETDAVSAKADLERTQVALAKIDRQIAAASLLPEEREALQRLDESLGLFDDGKVEPARAKLAEAKSRWSEGQVKRSVLKYKQIKLRVREELRGSAK